MFLDAVAHLDRDGISRRQVFEDRSHLVIPQVTPPWCQRKKVARGKDRVIGGRQQLDIFEQFLSLARRTGAERSEEPRGLQNGDALAHLLALLVSAPVARGQPLAVVPRIDDRVESTFHLRATLLRLFPRLGNTFGTFSHRPAQAMPAQEDADARKRDQPSRPVGPDDSVLNAVACLVRNICGCLRGGRDHPLAPAASTEVILRGVLDLLLNEQQRGNVLAEVRPHLAVGGRQRQDQVAVGPLVPIG